MSVADDLIHVAGHRHAENAYTRLAAWALGRDNDSPIAATIQRCWLMRLLPSVAISRPLDVAVQVVTDAGTPDLVLHGEGALIVVEAKTLTAEHDAAQTGRPQTFAYLPAIRRKFGRHTVSGETVFLTIRGEAPANPGAVGTTFLELALVILEALDGVEPTDIWAYRALASHWLTHSGIAQLNELAALSPDAPDLLDHLPELVRLSRLAPIRGMQ